MNTTYENYLPSALETALPSSLTLGYIIPGLIAELGELYGVQAKAIRDDYSGEETRTRLVAEYGDVAWFAALLVHLTEDRLPSHSKEYRVIPPAPELDALGSLLTRAAEFTHSAWDQRHVGPHATAWMAIRAQLLWSALEQYSERVTGAPFSEVLAYNIVKLADRKRRGVLSGSGDAR